MIIKKLFESIKENNSQEEVNEQVQDLKCEYVWDWEDEFESLDEAYEEQGRNGAEHQVIGHLINCAIHGYPIMNDDHNKLFEMIAEHYDLETK